MFFWFGFIYALDQSKEYYFKMSDSDKYFVFNDRKYDVKIGSLESAIKFKIKDDEENKNVKQIHFKEFPDDKIVFFRFMKKIIKDKIKNTVLKENSLFKFETVGKKKNVFLIRNENHCAAYNTEKNSLSVEKCNAEDKNQHIELVPVNDEEKDEKDNVKKDSKTDNKDVENKVDSSIKSNEKNEIAKVSKSENDPTTKKKSEILNEQSFKNSISAIKNVSENKNPGLIASKIEDIGSKNKTNNFSNDDSKNSVTNTTEMANFEMKKTETHNSENSMTNIQNNPFINKNLNSNSSGANFNNINKSSEFSSIDDSLSQKNSMNPNNSCEVGIRNGSKQFNELSKTMNGLESILKTEFQRKKNIFEPDSPEPLREDEKCEILCKLRSTKKFLS